MQISQRRVSVIDYCVHVSHLPCKDIIVEANSGEARRMLSRHFGCMIQQVFPFAKRSLSVLLEP